MMSNQNKRSNIIYHPETEVPAGSIDKRKVVRSQPDEQYPIPRAHPVPWQED
ncbi:hypothetical protein [Brevibacillus borstelensis]|uniref:hypothetical protein n=2 Tax=Brevibacillus TaxID=55080 RepID=UPI0030F7C21B